MRRLFVFGVAGIAASALPLMAQLDTSFFERIDHPAIGYHSRAASDPVAALNQKLATGEVRFSFDPVRGYLPSALEALKIPVESQMAIFSKTSVQAPLIAPRNPRTLFFNDAVAVGWMRGGFIEVASHDPRQGVVFYVLRQEPAETPQFFRIDSCLSCHYSYNTLGVPGMLSRSVITTDRGVAMQQLGNYVTDHRSPFEERWGGWYVTGSVGPMRHLGNAMVTDPEKFEDAITAGTLNAKSLSDKFDTSVYLSPHSDVAALLVFDHQAMMMNLITRVGWEARIGAPTAGHIKEFVDYLLFVDERPLPGKVQGTSAFAEKFALAGPHDAKGRSLRQLDLERRLLKYPCSYMIYSEAFDALPDAARTMIAQRVRTVLSGEDKDPRYARLSEGDRRAIREILDDTKKGFLPAR